MNPLAQFVFMTMYGNNATILSTALSYYLISKQSDSKVKGYSLSKVAQVLIEWTLAIEVTVTLAYWILLHDHMNRSQWHWNHLGQGNLCPRYPSRIR